MQTRCNEGKPEFGRQIKSLKTQMSTEIAAAFWGVGKANR